MRGVLRTQRKERAEEVGAQAARRSGRPRVWEAVLEIKVGMGVGGMGGAEV